MITTADRCSLRILLVDDEPDLHLASAEVLRAHGHEVRTASDGEQAREIMQSLNIDVLVTAVRLQKLDGLSLFRLTRQQSGATRTIFVAAACDVQDAVAAVKEGAHDYFRTPVVTEDIRRCIEAIAAQVSMQRDLVQVRVQLARFDSSVQIVGRSTVMCQLMGRIDVIAFSDAPVLLLGETGTGKELVARALHERGARRNQPFVAVNCASFPETRLDPELFGYARGALLDAVTHCAGRFEAAQGGTLLLDEVGDLSPAAQRKLLGIIDQHTLEPVGTRAAIPVDVRLVSASRRDLRKMVREGLFREDLYRRLQGFTLEVPPLRARDGDLPLLAQYFLNRFRRRGSTAARISPAAWSALSAFAFPGNVRQLAQAIEHATVMSIDHEIELRHLPVEVAG